MKRCAHSFGHFRSGRRASQNTTTHASRVSPEGSAELNVEFVTSCCQVKFVEPGLRVIRKLGTGWRCPEVGFGDSKPVSGQCPYCRRSVRNPADHKPPKGVVT